MQTVNTDYAVFNKTGTPVFGPVPMNTLFKGFGGLCETTNDGDPIVVYDPIADRWVASQFAVTPRAPVEGRVVHAAELRERRSSAGGRLRNRREPPAVCAEALCVRASAQ